EKCEYEQIAAHVRSADVAHVCAHREHPEKRAEHILAFRHPSHRFYVHRMQREQSGHKTTGGECVSHLVQKSEEQQSARNMQQEIRNVISAGVQSMQLSIEHQGYPS